MNRDATEQKAQDEHDDRRPQQDGRHLGDEFRAPNVSNGPKAPPMQALFAVSAAITPSIDPSPNFSGSLLIFLAVS
ncbi:MAG: hypothetical protein ACI9DF_004254 [Verrucomicrobiales bacterium]|jgi:hypothetical protein